MGVVRYADVEGLLAADAVDVAAWAFFEVFAGVELGHYVDWWRVKSTLKGAVAARTRKDSKALDAVAHECVLIWEQARIASRIGTSAVALLQTGARLFVSDNPIADLRGLLIRAT